MKTTSTLLAALFLVIGLTAASPDSDQKTVTGTLIDTKCYGMNHDNHGNEHMVMKPDGTGMMQVASCATACASMGIPVGLLEGGKKDGKVFILVTPAGQLAEHAAKEARVTGQEAYPGAIIPMKVEVKNADGEWEEVHIATMM